MQGNRCHGWRPDAVQHEIGGGLSGPAAPSKLEHICSCGSAVSRQLVTGNTGRCRRPNTTHKRKNRPPEVCATAVRYRCIKGSLHMNQVSDKIRAFFEKFERAN